MSDEILQLAIEIDKFNQEYDPYEYGDAVEDSEQALQELVEDIANGNVTYLIDYHQEILDEFSPEELAPGDYERVEAIIKKLEKFMPEVTKQNFVDVLLQDAAQRKPENAVKANDTKGYDR